MLKRLFLFWSVGFLMCVAHVAFTNLKCSFIDKNIGEFRYCDIKAVNRTHKYISIYSNIYQPIVNLAVNIKIMRNANGFKPFYVNITFDACQFFKKHQNPIILMVYNTIKDCSNINHTCPYNHDIVVDKLFTGDHERQFDKYFAIPSGDYAIYTTFFIRKTEVSNVKLYVKVT